MGFEPTTHKLEAQEGKVYEAFCFVKKSVGNSRIRLTGCAALTL